MKWDRETQKKVQEWMQSSKTLDILITGKTGSGKTALINGLIGRKVGEEGEELTRMTTHVDAKEFSLNGMEAKIWDTPGLQDDTDEEDRYLDEMKKYCSDCNLYIYCINMSQRRLDSADITAMGRLTNTFGKDWWKKVLFVLTFANSVEGYCPLGCDKREYFEGRVKMWHDTLVRKLVALGVEQEIAEVIVVVPTGYRKPLEQNPDPWALPGISNWFHNFWYKSAEVMDEKGLPALVTINHHRLKAPEDITEEDLKNCSIEEQPIPIHGRVAAAGGLALAGAAASAGVGAGIGAALGSIIGVLAGPAGVAGGAIVGGAMGTVIIDPIVVSLYWKYSEAKKSKQT